ncbi:MAG: carbamoyl-phosphate synthase large subunit, partial [Candidatus Daviesbacteria bacterium]|nr:carbamoyl-phosphate synthase large subunit [Candidatus Daviesbacteria bacterium]
MPRWDLQKFVGGKDEIGSEMKSVGEVMAIGRSFPEALQKAIRMLEIGQDGLLGSGLDQTKLLPTTERLFVIAQRFAKGESVDSIYKVTGIDPWFLYQIKEIVEFEKELQSNNILEAKKMGFSDKLLAKAFNKTEDQIRKYRKKHGILPKVKHIDTLSGEFPAKTNYLYLTYHGEESEDTTSSFVIARSKTTKQSNKEIATLIARNDRVPNKVIVLGSGPYRIGSSVEFDWCCVTAAKTLRAEGLETVIINCNPETVSTDYDCADKLYFEELTFERISDIYEIEGEASLVLGFGGQIPNNLAMGCFKAGYKILGTSPENIDQAEDRNKFSNILDKLNIDQPRWQNVKNTKEATGFAKKIGYPVLIRPSYVLSGSAMNVVFSPSELKKCLKQASDVSSVHPVVISKFVEGAKEIEIDGVGINGELLIYAISEHIENAGVHSGDATMVLPPQRLFLQTIRQIKDATKKILKELQINGPFNIQFLAKDNKILVIELNLRASRSFPFVSKVTGYNFVEMATKVMLGQDIGGEYNTLDLDCVAVKAPQFSFHRIKGADPRLRVEMSSTGEVACFGSDLQEAYLKAFLSVGFKSPKKSVYLSLGGEKNKLEFIPFAKILSEMGLIIYATEHTSKVLRKQGIKNTRVFKISEKSHPSVLDLLQKGRIDLAINISMPRSDQGETDGFLIRRNCIDLGIPLITNLQAAELLVSALSSKKM